MATAHRGTLPTVKCSACGVNVSIATIGEHICDSVPDDAPPLPPSKPDGDGPDVMPSESTSRSTLRFFRQSTVAKPTRTPPPRIDASAANRPFLDSDSPPPARNAFLNTASPFSQSQSPSPNSSTNFSKPQRSQTTPQFSTPTSPDSNQDRMFSRGRSKTFDNNDSRTASPAAINSENTWITYDGGKDSQLDGPDQQQPAPEDDKARKRRHRREASMDSKSIYKLSPNSLSEISSSISRPGRNVLDEAPPLPSGPIKTFSPSPYAAPAPPPHYEFESKEEVDNHQRASTSPPKDKREGANFSGLNFGLPTNPKPVNGQVEDGLGHKRQFSKPTITSDTQQGVESQGGGRGGSNPDNGNSYPGNEQISLSTFARGLGLDDPQHTAHESTSSTRSGSTPSEAQSGSSFSSRPSEGTTVSAIGSKSLPQPPSQHEHQQQQQKQRQQQADGAARPNRPEDVPPDSDLKPPQKSFERVPDSPTDPFSQGSAAPRHARAVQQNLTVDTQRIPVPPEPKSAGPRTPGSRPASRGPRPQCRGCGETITGKSISSADGRLTGRYHKACFVCQVCNSAFQTADFYILNNNPYCAQHYHQLNGTLCAGCNVGIEGPCRQTEDPEDEEGNKDDSSSNGPSRNQRYHPECFKCRTCRVILEGDYFDWDGQVYCERDARRAALASQGHMMPPPPNHPPHPPHSPGPYGRRPPPPHPPPNRGPPGPGPGPGGPRGGPPPPRGRPGPRRGPGPPLPPNPHGGPPPGYGPPSPRGGRLGVPRGGGGGPGGGPRLPEKRTTKLLMI